MLVRPQMTTRTTSKTPISISSMLTATTIAITILIQSLPLLLIIHQLLNSIRLLKKRESINAKLVAENLRQADMFQDILEFTPVSENMFAHFLGVEPDLLVTTTACNTIRLIAT